LGSLDLPEDFRHATYRLPDLVFGQSGVAKNQRSLAEAAWTAIFMGGTARERIEANATIERDVGSLKTFGIPLPQYWCQSQPISISGGG